MISGMITVLAAVTCQPLQIAHPDPDGVVGRMREAVMRGEMTEQELLLKVEELARKYRDLVDAAAGPEHFLTSSSRDVDRCMGAMTILQRIGDRHSLPLFEDMAGSKHVEIHLHGIRAYIKLAGVVDSLPFIERMSKVPHYFDLNRFAGYQSLERIINDSPTPPEGIEKVCVFMLEKVQSEKGGIAQLMDKVLTKHLPGYSSSVQRDELVEKFGDSETAYVKKYWSDAKEEIEKKPAKERKDFRAKGELLDPKRKKEP